MQVNQTFGGGGRVYRRHRRAVRRSEGSTTISQRSKRDRDTEPDLIRNQDILRKISTTKKLPRSFVMGSEASERSEKNSITTSKATQKGTVTFPVDYYICSPLYRVYSCCSSPITWPSELTNRRCGQSAVGVVPKKYDIRTKNEFDI